ncbi:hypothetical protein BGX21_006110, partial [Mortierella sp. AD011]
KWTYETKTYETFEEVEEVEEVVTEEEARTIVPAEGTTTVVTREEKPLIVTSDDGYGTQTTTTTTTATTVTTTIQPETVVVTENVIDGDEIAKVVTAVRETSVVAKPAVPKETSWLRRIATGAGAVAAGAGVAAAGALTKADGVWKRTVEVLTTRKAPVDEVCPYAKSSFVYYDEDIYDAVLVEKNSGLSHHMQLIYNNEDKSYYVYNRWGEKDYKLDGPHKTIEAAKASFLVIFKEWYGLEWSQRETAGSDRWTYEVKTYEVVEEREVVEEVVDDREVVVTENQKNVDETVVTTEKSVTTTHDDNNVTRTQYETVTRIEGAAPSSGSSTVIEEKKIVLDINTLPTLENVGIDPNTGAAIGVIDLRSGTAENLRELPADVRPRPRAWVSLHVGGWQDAPHELEGFMRLDDQSGQRLMEQARDAADGKAQESTRIDNLRLPEIVALFAQKLYGHFEEELPEELSLERLSALGPHRR